MQIKQCIIIGYCWETWEWLEVTARFSFSLLRDGGWRLAFWASRPFALCALVSKRSVSGTNSPQSCSTQEKETNHVNQRTRCSFNYLPWSLELMMVMNVLQIKKWKYYMGTSVLNSIKFPSTFVPSSESTDCALVESWLLNLLSAADSWPLWLSTTEAPLDSRTVICGQNNTDSFQCLTVTLLCCISLFSFRAGVLPCSASSPAAPCTTCLFHLEFFSAPPPSSQSLSLWGEKEEMWSPISPLACKHAQLHVIITETLRSLQQLFSFQK